jgi:hypothetical protein
MYSVCKRARDGSFVVDRSTFRVKFFIACTASPSDMEAIADACKVQLINRMVIPQDLEQAVARGYAPIAMVESFKSSSADVKISGRELKLSNEYGRACGEERTTFHQGLSEFIAASRRAYVHHDFAGEDGQPPATKPIRVISVILECTSHRNNAEPTMLQVGFLGGYAAMVLMHHCTLTPTPSLPTISYAAGPAHGAGVPRLVLLHRAGRRRRARPGPGIVRADGRRLPQVITRLSGEFGARLWVFLPHHKQHDETDAR